MKNSRFSPDIIVGALDEVSKGAAVREISVRLGVSESTFYRWQKEYKSLPPDGIQTVRQLKHENARLRSLVYNQALQIEQLKSDLGNYLVPRQN